MRTLILASVAILILASCSGLAAPQKGWNTDLNKALAQARKENKMGFIVLGREDCGNCRATKKLVNEGSVPVTTDKFVIADIDTDNPAADAKFLQKYGRDNFGNTLPFVVITAPDGRALAKYSGYKDPQALTKLLREATAKAAPRS